MNFKYLRKSLFAINIQLILFELNKLMIIKIEILVDNKFIDENAFELIIKKID
jgi:hypothetical protein